MKLLRPYRMVFAAIIFLASIFVSPAAAGVITNWTKDQINPAIAHNPISDQYLVVWEHVHSETDHDIYAQRVAADGSLLSSVIYIARSNNYEGKPAVAFNVASGQYLVVWEYEYSATDYDIYGLRLSGTGGSIGNASAIAFSGAMETSPDVAANSSNQEFLIAYEQLAGSGEFTHNNISASRMHKDGYLVGSVITIQNGSLDESAPALEYSSISDRYLVVWQEIQSGTGAYNIHGRILGATGSLIGSEITVATWEYDLIKPRLAFNSNLNEFLVVWEDHRWAWGAARDIYGQRITAAGGLAGGNFGITWEGTNLRLNPDVAYKPSINEYLVICEYEYSPSDHDIYVRRVSAYGTLLEGDMRIAGGSAFEGRPVVAADNNLDFLVVWEDSRNAGSTGIDIYGDLFAIKEFSGVVYSGYPNNQDHPLAGAEVGLYCSNNSTSYGTLIDSMVTDTDGWFGLLVAGVCEYYNIVEVDPDDYVSTGASSIDGHVRNSNWIQYLTPLGGKNLGGNRFWEKETIQPGGWTDFSPTGWIADQTVTCSIKVRDTLSGLYVNSARYAFSKDGGSSWSPWYGAACSGTNETTSYQTITAFNVAFGQDSGAANSNRIKFRIDDMHGNIGISGSYSVYIDTTPPAVLSGPTVENVSPTSVRVLWETDENSDSRVFYGRTAGQHSSEELNPNMVKNHDVLLTGLEPSATYHLVAESKDRMGYRVQTAEVIFETMPLPDSQNPSLVVIEPPSFEGIVTLSSNASDNTGIEKVQYFLDDELIHTAFGPKFEFKLDTTKYASGAHTLTVKAYDLAGRYTIDQRVIAMVNVVDEAAPTVDIISPAQDGASVSGKVDVIARLDDDTGLRYVYFKVNGIGESFKPLPDKPLTKDVTFEWDTTLVPNGSYTLAVEVYDDDKPYAKYGYGTRQVTVNQVPPALPPKLKVSHRVTRHGNYFAVELSVTNVGEEPAQKIRIQDFLRGFQPISASYQIPFQAVYKAKYNSWKQEWECEITTTEDIPANSSKSFTYFAVPVMLDVDQIIPTIGFLTGLHYDEDPRGLRIHDWYAVPADKTWNNATIPKAYDLALKEADYLIVTHPNKLFAFGPSQLDAVEGLLSDMAELARYKNGALAYMENYDKELLRELIRAGVPFLFDTYLVEPGKWSAKLKDDWDSDGYLLLVGENQIIPAWCIKMGTHETTAGDHTWIADPTDFPYASTYGDQLIPELSMGRIIGDNPTELRKPLRTSIALIKGSVGFKFDRTSSLLISGFPRAMSGKAMNILTKQEVDGVLTQILKKPVFPLFSQSIWHTPSYTVYDNTGKIDETATSNAITAEFLADAPDQDVIFVAGHGNQDSWDEVHKNDITGQTNIFGNTNPFVFASSCITGKYTGGARFAEAFLSQGAAAYLGAIEKGGCYKGEVCPGAGTFFAKWDLDEPVGLALKQTKLSLGNSFTHRLWKGIYHIFGDPKFGAVSGSGAGAAAATEAETGGASVIEIDIPDYEVTEIDGQDHVEIPGGLVLRQTGMPAVPYLKMLYHFPAGYQIQDVALVERSHHETSSGLELPLSTLGVLGCCEPDYEVEPPVIPSWWPEKIYEWTVQESSTTTTLALTVYPFHYYHQTTEAEFFKYFRFDVEYIESEVEVVHLATDKQTYAPGESVLIDFMLNKASTQAQDVVMEAVVKQAGSQEFVSGLLLHTLKDFVGQASWSTEWDSDSFPPGYYSVHVILKDTLGVLLDRKIETFRLGVSSGEIASLDVAPQYFDIGDRIDVDMNFTNSGSIDLDGTAVIKVLDANGETVQEFFHEMTNLAPGSTIGFNDTWETSAASPGPYHVMGFGYYDGGATEPAVELISTTNCLFDLDHDGDVDGKDLADVVEKFGDHFGPEDLPGLSSTLGRSNCFELD